MGKTHHKAEEEGARSFARFLEMVDDGRAVIALSEAQQKLLVDMKELVEKSWRECKGALVLKLGFVAREGGQVDVVYEIETKSPKEKHARSTFFMTPGANVTLENPKQQKLPLREVPERGEERDFDPETGEVRDV